MSEFSFTINNYNELNNYKKLNELAKEKIDSLQKEDIFNKNLAPSTEFKILDDLNFFQNLRTKFDQDKKNVSKNETISLDNPNQIGKIEEIDFEDFSFFKNTEPNDNFYQNEYTDKNEEPQNLNEETNSNKGNLRKIFDKEINIIKRPEIDYEKIGYLFDNREKKFLKETFDEACDMEILTLSLNALDIGNYIPNIKKNYEVSKFDLDKFNLQEKNFSGKNN